MSRLNQLLSFKPSRIWSYGIAILSVSSAWTFAQLLGLGPGFPATPFFCAIVLTAWYGGVGPALLAIALSHLGFFLHHRFAFSVGNLMYTASNILLAGLGIAQRNAKESLRHARDDLERTVEDLQATNEALHAESRERKRTQDALGQAQADLARASRLSSMGELTASLAHEVSQPIAASITNASTCLRWLSRGQPDLEEARAAAARAAQAGKRASEILSRVRMLFKKGTWERELVNLNEAIQEMVQLLRSEATQFAVSVRAELDADLPQVSGDRVQLQQVLMNLMMNSIDAMKEVNGTHELTVQSQRADDGRVLISVTDTGVGLPRQQADKIFDAFFTTKPNGTGIGLRISRSIVEAHGGRLWATDHPPRGARFSFILPIDGGPGDSAESGDRPTTAAPT